MTSVLLALALSAANVNTANMHLVLPTPGQSGAFGTVPPGTSWLERLNTALGVIDQHDHSPSHGAPVSSSGINVNAPLNFKGQDATTLRSARFTPQVAPLSGPADAGAVYVSGSDLWFTDVPGNQIRLTAAGGLAGTPGSISGLSSPAAVSYSAAPKTFTFESASGVKANMLHGPLSIFDPIASGKAATVIVPSGLAANYQLTLPSALPASTNPVTMTSAGVLAANVDLTVPGALTSTGAATMSSTLGVTGATTLSTLTVNTTATVPSPVNATDAARKDYVDVLKVKASARLDCGGAGAVTVRGGHNIASASYSGNVLTVNMTASTNSLYGVLVTSHTGYVVYYVTPTSATQFQITQLAPNTGSASNYGSGTNVAVFVVGDP